MTIHDKKKKAEQKEEKEGTLRLLTSGEIALAKSVFRSTIPYHKVWIHHDSYLPFGLQNKNTAMAPNGEIYFREHYREDYSLSVPFYKHMFIHEMVHVWQREKGMNVICRGLVSWAVSYRYVLDGRLLSEYPMEQQAQIISDHFILLAEGYIKWCGLRDLNVITLDGNISEPVIEKQYANALRGFPW
ncbi:MULTISPECIES: type IV secretion protein Rhs [unclassified Leclercia]|uniref:type IV secretion protein Rhs n=1 Tax=unclassified Leclercia TaxID=2627398 RepID=UPI000DF1C830|nr:MULTISPECIES: type IV secretion protein Rhs [unclassified Leclercia]AXF58948.1 type IV secretion protein Rhs [Leclercia sp. W6]AXF64540.1 type IV secretion protein Rhs [Leclercia sp. W17]